MPWSEFYTGNYGGIPGDWSYRELNPDRFPTDVVIFQLLGQILNLFPQAQWESVVFTEIQAVTWIFEVAMVVVLVLIIRKLMPEKSLSKTLLLFLLPPVWIIATWSFTWEFIPTFFILLGFYLLLQERWYTQILGGCAFALALLERPHFIFLAIPLVAISYIRTRKVAPLGFVGLGGLITGLGLLYSFKLGLFWEDARGSLLDLFQYNAVFYDKFTSSGASLWSLWPQSTSTLYESVDPLGIPVMGWAMVLITLVGGLGLYGFLKISDKTFAVIWFFALIAQATFVFLPRMLERYNFTAIILIFLLWLLYSNRATKTLLITISAISFLNILAIEINEWLYWNMGIPVEDNVIALEQTYRILALGNLFVFYLLWKVIRDQIKPHINQMKELSS